MMTAPVACVVDASVGIKPVITEPLSAHRLGILLVTADTRLVARLAGSPYRALDLAALTIPPPPP